MILMTKKLDVEQLNERFEKAQPQEIIDWAISEFRPKIALTSSFQTESIVLLDMVSKIDKSMPILFLETGWHFKETLEFKNEVIKRFGLTNVIDLKADPAKRETFNQESNNKPYETNPDYCCQINKVEPLERALQIYDAWISGIRRSQSKTRKDIKIVEEYSSGPFKINPLANVTSGDIWWYMKEHNLPKHPLFDKGYLSIGCWPCTRPVQPGDDERSGRWAGKEKIECGIHTFMKPKTAPTASPAETSEEKQEGSNI